MKWFQILTAIVFVSMPHLAMAAESTYTIEHDGSVRRLNLSSETFASIRAGDGTHAFDGSGGINLGALSVTDQYHVIDRWIFSFDTAALPDDATIDSVTLRLKATTPTCTIDGDVNFTTANPGNITDLVASDYALSVYGTEALSDTEIACSEWNTSDWNTFTLNAEGIAAINREGNTIFAMRSMWDIANTPPTWIEDGQLYIAPDGVGDTAPGELIVVYNTGAGGGGNTTAMPLDDQYAFIATGLFLLTLIALGSLFRKAV